MKLPVALLLLVASACAEDFGALRPQGYVSDFAGVVDAQSRQRLESYAASLKAATGAELAIVVLPSLQGEPVEDVAVAIFKKWGIGKKGDTANDPNRDQGVLLLLSIGDRRNRIEVGYGLEPIIPDGFAGNVLRDMRPALREANYGEALLLGAESIGATIAKAKNVTLAPIEGQHHRERPTQIPWSVILGGIVVVLWLIRAIGGGRGGYYGGGGGGSIIPGLILGSLMGGRRGGSGGGGFGGYDSNDTFGGFGGGSSGGGGASSSW